MLSSRIKYEVFHSPLFVSALFVLLINDYFLKYQFTSWLTGKLSDFAGIFVFAQFFFALFPNKTRTTACITALSFVYWKSPLSQPLIDGWNSLAIVPVTRTVDASDLLALAMLPIARLYFFSLQRSPTPKTLAFPVALLALVAIMGTAVPSTGHRLQFQMQDGPLPSLSSIHGVLEEVARQHQFKCVECDPKESYRMYSRDGTWLEMNFDARTNILFVSIVGHGDAEKETKEMGAQIGSAISARLKSIYNNVDVRIYRPETEEPWVRSSLKARLSGARVPFLCWPSETSPQIISLFDELDSYARSNGYKDLTNYRCHPPGLCRYYLNGRVIGPYVYSRSTSVEARGGCSLLGKFIEINVQQGTEDNTIDVSKTILELRSLVEQFTQKDVTVETLGKAAPK